MTGTTMFTTSRILSAWQQRGIIESGRERLLILKPDDLLAIAEDLPQ
jgi:CRP/FNR family transcriptional regulator, nitrogen oxide reductase regulator